MVLKPRIIAFFSKWCGGYAAETAGVSRLKYAPEFMIFNIPCCGRISADHIVDAFLLGADAVFLGECMPPANCHYKTGNFKIYKRVYLLKKLMSEFGIEGERLHLEWFVSPQAGKVAKVATEFVEKIRKLGPIWGDWGEA